MFTGIVAVLLGLGLGAPRGGVLGPAFAFDLVPTKLAVPDVTGTITDTVSLTATLTTLTDDPIAGADIAFAVDGTAVGTDATDASGVAVIAYLIPSGAAGAVAIDAAFAGDAAYAACTGSGTLTRQQIDTKMAVPNRSGEVGLSATLRAYLYRTDDTGVAGKSLSFKVDGTAVGSGTTSSTGLAQFAYGPIPPGAGSRPIVANWAGDDGYRTSSGSGTLYVTKPAVYVVVLTRTTVPGDIFKPKALVRRLPDYALLSGKSITFKVDGTSIGSGTTAANGYATVSYGGTTTWTQGSHTCRAEFAGDDYVAAGSGEAPFNVLAGPSFAAPIVYSVPKPQQMAAAFLDGDGFLDLAVPSMDGNLYVLYGRGDGTFDAPVAYPVSRGGHDVIAVDLNADGRLDIVECQEHEGRIAVVPNYGGRVFGTPTYYDMGPKPYGLASGDFDRDGDPDLAVSVDGNQRLTVLPNNGDGTFGTPTHYGGGQYPSFTHCADFNRDGFLDLAVTTMYDDYINLYRGNGQGGFTHIGSIRPGSYPGGMAWGDLDGDGMGDLAVTNQQGHTVNVLFTRRNRAFVLSPPYQAGGYPYRVAYAAVDTDGRRDLVVSNGATYFTVLRNLGGGVLSSPFSFASAGRDGRGLAVADFNRDGRPDVATSSDTDNSVAISLNTTP